MAKPPWWTGTASTWRGREGLTPWVSSVRALELVRTPPQRSHWCVRWGDLGLWPFLHPEWHQRMLRNIIGASSRRSFLCFWVQSDDWWSDGCQYSLWTKLRLIRLNLNLIVKAICSSLRWRSWNKMSKIEFVLVFLNFLKNCEANVIKDAEK